MSPFTVKVPLTAIATMPPAPPPQLDGGTSRVPVVMEAFVYSGTRITCARASTFAK